MCQGGEGAAGSRGQEAQETGHQNLWVRSTGYLSTVAAPFWLPPPTVATGEVGSESMILSWVFVLFVLFLWVAMPRKPRTPGVPMVSIMGLELGTISPGVGGSRQAMS